MLPDVNKQEFRVDVFEVLMEGSDDLLRERMISWKERRVKLIVR
jgi:hypothetical protein